MSYGRVQASGSTAAAGMRAASAGRSSAEPRAPPRLAHAPPARPNSHAVIFTFLIEPRFFFVFHGAMRLGFVQCSCIVWLPLRMIVSKVYLDHHYPARMLMFPKFWK